MLRDLLRWKGELFLINKAMLLCKLTEYELSDLLREKKAIARKIFLERSFRTNFSRTKVVRTKKVRTKVVRTKVVRTKVVRTKVVRTKVVRTKAAWPPRRVLISQLSEKRSRKKRLSGCRGWKEEEREDQEKSLQVILFLRTHSWILSLPLLPTYAHPPMYYFYIIRGTIYLFLSTYTYITTLKQCISSQFFIAALLCFP
jgi:hypothetical protein